MLENIRRLFRGRKTNAANDISKVVFTIAVDSTQSILNFRTNEIDNSRVEKSAVLLECLAVYFYWASVYSGSKVDFNSIETRVQQRLGYGFMQIYNQKLDDKPRDLTFQESTKILILRSEVYAVLDSVCGEDNLVAGVQALLDEASRRIIEMVLPKIWEEKEIYKQLISLTLRKGLGKILPL